MNYKALLILALVINITFGYWSLELKNQIVKTVSDQSPPLDDIYFFPATFEQGGKPINVIFDTTIDKNWQKQTEPVDGAVNTIQALGGRGELTGVKLVQDITVNGKKLKNTELYKTTDASLKPFDEKAVFDVIQAGFALGKGENNFVQSVMKNINLEHLGVSFFFHDQIDQIRFGPREKYFAIEDFTTFPNLSTESTRWALKIEKVTTNNQAQVVATGSGKTAVFDSSTKFIWGNANFISDIKSQLNSKQPDIICNNEATESVIVCQCKGDFPDISFEFTGQKGKTFTIRKGDYLKPWKDDKCVLLFRESRSFSTGAVKKPDTEEIIYLGTSFLSGVYTHFDQQNNQIHLAKAYVPFVQPKHIDNTWRYIFTIGGLVLFFVSVLALLSILHKCPYKPLQVPQPLPQPKVEEKTVNQQITFPQQQAPQLQQQQVFIQQQPYVLQSGNLQQSGPVYYANQPINYSPNKVQTVYKQF